MKTNPIVDLLKRPLHGKGTLNINVRRYYTTVDGLVLNKAVPADLAQIPAALRVALPVFLLGNFDRVGGFNIANRVTEYPASAIFLNTYVHGYGEQPFPLWSSGYNDLQQFLKRGDIICQFTDSLTAPTCFAFIVQTCQYGALASIISNTQTQQDDGKYGYMTIDGVSMQVSTPAQIDNVAMILTKYDNLGLSSQIVYNPVTAKNPQVYKLNDYVDLAISVPALTQYFGINTLFLYESDYVNLNFKITK